VLLGPASADRPMIRLDNISKQNGHQILFIEASMGVQKGEKVGLVGPNGAGKSTLLKLVAGATAPDQGGGYAEYVARTGQEAPGLHPGG
jgi:ATPase subunit of ABC transporter with duplicated ATPase domains